MISNMIRFNKTKIQIAKQVCIQKICLIKMRMFQNTILFRSCRSLIARQVLNLITHLIRTISKKALQTLVQMSSKQSILVTQTAKLFQKKTQANPFKPNSMARLFTKPSLPTESIRTKIDTETHLTSNQEQKTEIHLAGLEIIYLTLITRFSTIKRFGKL